MTREVTLTFSFIDEDYELVIEIEDYPAAKEHLVDWDPNSEIVQVIRQSDQFDCDPQIFVQRLNKEDWDNINELIHNKISEEGY